MQRTTQNAYSPLATAKNPQYLQLLQVQNRHRGTQIQIPQERTKQTTTQPHLYCSHPSTYAQHTTRKERQPLHTQAKQTTSSNKQLHIHDGTQQQNMELPTTRHQNRNEPQTLQILAPQPPPSAAEPINSTQPKANQHRSPPSLGDRTWQAIGYCHTPSY